MMRKLFLLSAVVAVLAGCNSSSTPAFIGPSQALYVSNAGGTFGVYALPFSSGATASPVLTIPDSTSPLADDVAVDGAGHLFELDNDFAPVVIYEYQRPLVAAQTPFATIGVTGYNNCQYLALDPAGNLWASCAPGAVELAGPFTASGSYSATIAATVGGVTKPKQLAFDGAGDLFEADGVSGVVWIFKAPVQNGNTPSGSLTFVGAQGVAVDAAGNVYASAGTSNLGDNSLRRWNAPVSTTTLNQTASVIDPSSATTLTNLSGLSFDAAGNLYVGTCVTDGGAGSVAVFSSSSLATFSSSTAPSFTNTGTGCGFGVKVTLR